MTAHLEIFSGFNVFAETFVLAAKWSGKVGSMERRK
jgi:hypothetical protein